MDDDHGQVKFLPKSRWAREKIPEDSPTIDGFTVRQMITAAPSLSPYRALRAAARQGGFARPGESHGESQAVFQTKALPRPEARHEGPGTC